MLKVNWEEYEQLIYKLYEKVKYEPFDQILCIGRGGFLIGDILSRVCEKPLSVILASSYNGKEQNHLRWSPIANLQPILGTVLLVDDMVDSGTTLSIIKKRVINRQGVTSVKTGVIWKKENSKFMPDFFVEHIGKDVWIEQPFEKNTGA